MQIPWFVALFLIASALYSYVPAVARFRAGREEDCSLWLRALPVPHRPRPFSGYIEGRRRSSATDGSNPLGVYFLRGVGRCEVGIGPTQNLS